VKEKAAGMIEDLSGGSVQASGLDPRKACKSWVALYPGGETLGLRVLHPALKKMQFPVSLLTIRSRE
jgi:hypothetical protein